MERIDEAVLVEVALKLNPDPSARLERLQIDIAIPDGNYGEDLRCLLE
jgi:hypothetical protein